MTPSGASPAGCRSVASRTTTAPAGSEWQRWPCPPDPRRTAVPSRLPFMLTDQAVRLSPVISLSGPPSGTGRAGQVPEAWNLPSTRQERGPRPSEAA
jgi:hypothetical protein